LKYLKLLLKILKLGNN